jgi:hypothetical protein
MMGMSGDSTGVIIISLSTCLGIERFMFWMRWKQALRERGAPGRKRRRT